MNQYMRVQLLAQVVVIAPGYRVLVCHAFTAPDSDIKEFNKKHFFSQSLDVYLFMLHEIPNH